MPQSLDTYDQSVVGDRGVLVLESSDQMNPMAGRKNNEPLSVQMGQGTGSITGSQSASPMRHDKKQQSLPTPIIGMPVPSGTSVQMVTIPSMGHMGQGQVGAIPPEFVPRAGMHYDGQQQGYLQQPQQQGGHQQYQSYVPYPANQAYLHNQQPHITYHQQIMPGVGVRAAQQPHYQHQGIGHDMSMMHQQQQQQQHHNLGRGRPDERGENYANNYNGNNRAMNGYTNTNNPYPRMSASISDYPYDASYGSNQQGGQVAAYYGPMPVQVAMDSGIPIPGGIIAVSAMAPDHERLLVLAKGNEQHKQVSDMLLKAAQSEAATSKKRCEELGQQVEDLKKQLEDVRLENEALRLAASDAEIAVELKQAEGTAEKLREDAVLIASKRDLVATPPPKDSDSDSDRESEPYSEQKVGPKHHGADKGQERHGTDQVATSLVKAVLLSPTQSSGGSPLPGAIKTAGNRRTWADADDEDDDEGVPTNRFDQRGAQQGRGQHPRSGSGQFDGVYKGPGKDRENDQYGRGTKQHSSSYSSTDKGRERDTGLFHSGGPGRGGAGRGSQGQGQGQGQGMTMRGSSSAAGGAGGAGNVARPLRPTRIIHPSGMPTVPGGQMNNRIVDSVSTDQGDGQSQVQEQSGDGPGPASESKIEAAVHKGDIRKMPGSSMHDFPKKATINSPPPLGPKSIHNIRTYSNTPHDSRDTSHQRDAHDSDINSPTRRKGPPAQFISNSLDDHGRSSGSSWRDSATDARRRDPVRGGERRNDEDYESQRDGPGSGPGPMKMNVSADRRAEAARGKKFVKPPRQDKLQSEREGRSDWAGGAGDSRGAVEDLEDREGGESSRPRPSEFPLDSRDSSSEAPFTPLLSSSLVADSAEGISPPIPSSSSALPSGSGQAPLDGSENRSSNLCRYFSKGMCKFGSKCDYSHSGAGGGKLLSRTPTQEEGAAREDGQDVGSLRGDRVDKRERAPGALAGPGRGKGRESSSGRGRGGRGVKKVVSALPIASNMDGADLPPAAVVSAAPAGHAPNSSGSEHDL